MTNISKYVALEEYIPSGDPQLSHFKIREEKINIDDVIKLTNLAES